MTIRLIGIHAAAAVIAFAVMVAPAGAQSARDFKVLQNQVKTLEKLVASMQKQLRSKSSQAGASGGGGASASAVSALEQRLDAIEDAIVITSSKVKINRKVEIDGDFQQKSGKFNVNANTVAIKGTSVILESANTVKIKGGGTVTLEGAIANIKAALVKLGTGTVARPVARAGDVVVGPPGAGVISAGSSQVLVP